MMRLVRSSSFMRYVSGVETATTERTERVDRARRGRLAWIIGITLAVELGLAVLTHFGPALALLVRPVYVVVAVIGAFTVWRALTRRPGQDRRHGDRRHHAGG